MARSRLAPNALALGDPRVPGWNAEARRRQRPQEDVLGRVVQGARVKQSARLVLLLCGLLRSLRLCVPNSGDPNGPACDVVPERRGIRVVFQVRPETPWSE
jgi:hypothetical protein